jgi:hypothetical protein
VFWLACAGEQAVALWELEYETIGDVPPTVTFTLTQGATTGEGFAPDYPILTDPPASEEEPWGAAAILTISGLLHHESEFGDGFASLIVHATPYDPVTSETGSVLDYDLTEFVSCPPAGGIIAGTNNAFDSNGFTDPDGGINSDDVYVAFYDNFDGGCADWNDFIILSNNRTDITTATIVSGAFELVNEACPNGCCVGNSGECDIAISPSDVGSTVPVSSPIAMTPHPTLPGVFYVSKTALGVSDGVGNFVIDTDIADGIGWIVAQTTCF